MTQEQYDNLLEACKPTIMIGNAEVGTFGPSPQENANRAWQALADEMGFHWSTAQPIEGKDAKHFTAVPKEGNHGQI